VSELRVLRPDRDEVAIAVGDREDGGRAADAVLVGALANGAGRPRRLAIGPAHGADMLGDVLDGGRGRGAVRALEVVPANGDLTAWLREKSPDEVYLVLDGAIDGELLAAIGARLLMDGVALHFVLPGGIGRPPLTATVASRGGHPCVSLRPVPDSRIARALRRLIDVLGAAALLVVLSPVMLVLAVLVWWTMGRPVLHVQERVGQSARRFRLYKFRSMVCDAEQILRASPELYRRYVATSYKLPQSEDPRVTPLGHFLRRTSLDELPQLWNVLRGDMSLVGPRPVVPEEVGEYGDYGRMLLRVKPGLTGAWQVAGRSAVGYPERARMDLRYVAGRSLPGDVGILLRTLPAVVRRRGVL
jgi:exopolysaccharide production protein ExoY